MALSRQRFEFVPDGLVDLGTDFPLGNRACPGATTASRPNGSRGSSNIHNHLRLHLGVPVISMPIYGNDLSRNMPGGFGA